MSAAPRQPGWLARAERIGRHLESALLTLLLAALILISFGQIVLRNVFSTGLAWADGGTQLLVLWLAVIGAVAATRDRRHISINLAARLLPAALHRWTQVLIDAFAAAVTGYFTVQAFRFVADSRAFGDTLLDGVAAWPLQAVLPAGFALITYRFCVHCLAGMLRRD